jgi:hypothetical protein
MDPLGKPVCYSPAGQAAAKKALQSAQEAASWKEKMTLLGDGFQSIEDSPLATRDEKALAALGKSLGVELAKGSVTDQESPALVMACVMGALANSMPGPLGNVVAQVSSQALDSLGLGITLKNCLSFLKTGSLDLSKLKRDYAGEILNNGFSTILGNPLVTETEEALSKLGMEVSPLEAGASIMQALIHPLPGPIASVIARTALAAERRCDSFGSVHVLACGFSAIKENKDIPGAVRKYAEEGYSAHPDDFAPDPIEERKAMLPFMKGIPAIALQEAEKEVERKTAEEREELEEMIGDASRETAPVDVEEDFIAIDGVRLDRHSSGESR